MKRSDRPFAVLCAVGLLLAVGFYMHSCANSRARVEVRP